MTFNSEYNFFYFMFRSWLQIQNVQQLIHPLLMPYIPCMMGNFYTFLSLIEVTCFILRAKLIPIFFDFSSWFIYVWMAGCRWWCSCCCWCNPYHSCSCGYSKSSPYFSFTIFNMANQLQSKVILHDFCGIVSLNFLDSMKELCLNFSCATSLTCYWWWSDYTQQV